MLNLFVALVGIFALFCIVARLLHRYFVYVPDPTRATPKDAGLFGGSGGRPTEKRNAADAVSAYDTLRGLGVVPDDVVIYGESLGSAVATRLCPQRQPKALVLEAPFTSVVDVGRLMWPLLPLKFIMVDQYRTVDRIDQVDVPLFIVHGARDATIPVDHARRLFHAASEPKTLRVVSKAGHNDLFEQGAWTEVRDFFASLTPEPVGVLPVERAGRPVEAVAAANADK